MVQFFKAQYSIANESMASYSIVKYGTHSGKLFYFALAAILHLFITVYIYTHMYYHEKQGPKLSCSTMFYHITSVKFNVVNI